MQICANSVPFVFVHTRTLELHGKHAPSAIAWLQNIPGWPGCVLAANLVQFSTSSHANKQANANEPANEQNGKGEKN